MEQATAFALDALARQGVTQCGILPFETLLPLRPCRAARTLPDGIQCVIVCALPYYPGHFHPRNVCLYAVADDYHRTITELLRPVCEALRARYPSHTFLSFTDNSPFREVEAARMAGLGVVGRHGLLIAPQGGSFVLLAEIATTLPLALHKPAVPAHCLHCDACRRRCPTGALGENGLVKERCRSFLTQKRGVLTPWESAQIRQGGLVWGCDLCQLGCPLNASTPAATLPALLQNLHPHLTEDKVDDNLLNTKAYGWRGKDIILRNIKLVNQFI